MKAIMANQENNMATVKNIEIHMGQIVKELAKGQSDQFQPTPKPTQESILMKLPLEVVE